LYRLGWLLRQIAVELGCARGPVWRAVGEGRRFGRRAQARDDWQPGGGWLSLAEREEISVGVGRGETFTAIAVGLGRSVSTGSRQVASNGGRENYRAWRAHARSFERARRPKPAKLDCSCLAAQVGEWMRQWWSPQEIGRRLRIEFPHDPMMWVSHEMSFPRFGGRVGLGDQAAGVVAFRFS
jgi:hypothetical protein